MKQCNSEQLDEFKAIELDFGFQLDEQEKEEIRENLLEALNIVLKRRGEDDLYKILQKQFLGEQETLSLSFDDEPDEPDEPVPLVRRVLDAHDKVSGRRYGGLGKVRNKLSVSDFIRKLEVIFFEYKIVSAQKNIRAKSVQQKLLFLECISKQIEKTGPDFPQLEKRFLASQRQYKKYHFSIADNTACKYLMHVLALYMFECECQRIGLNPAELSDYYASGIHPNYELLKIEERIISFWNALSEFEQLQKPKANQLRDLLVKLKDGLPLLIPAMSRLHETFNPRQMAIDVYPRSGPTLAFIHGFVKLMVKEGGLKEFISSSRLRDTAIDLLVAVMPDADEKDCKFLHSQTHLNTAMKMETGEDLKSPYAYTKARVLIQNPLKAGFIFYPDANADDLDEGAPVGLLGEKFDQRLDLLPPNVKKSKKSQDRENKYRKSDLYKERKAERDRLKSLNAELSPTGTKKGKGGTS